MIVRRALLADGSTVDVRIEGAFVAEVGTGLVATDDEVVHDVGGQLLLPAFAEPHAHLDKAFLAERVPNHTGDLLGAIEGMMANRAAMDTGDIVLRAERAVRLLAANGVSVVRTHADTVPDHGLRSVEALLEVRRRTAHLIEMQIVALSGWPITGPEGADARALLRDALELGADLVGGCPHLDERPEEANDVLLTLAADHGRDLDLHTDETLDPSAIALEDLAHRVSRTGFPHRVTASHCVSLGMQAPERQREISEAVAAAGIGVVALPHTNLFLQGRDRPTATPRGLTAVAALTAAGVAVAAGADNLQDPFNPVGRGDPLETAGLMIMVGHLLPDRALDSVSATAHVVLGAPPPGIRVGSRADLVVVPAASVREAIAMGSARTFVMHRGSVTHLDGRATTE